MDTLDFTTVPRFLDAVRARGVAGNHPLLYRGQAVDAPLLPKIARRDPSNNPEAREREMLTEFRPRGGLLLGREADAEWDLLVYAQHLGMATRLLDWTSNPLVALWFACECLSCGPAFVYMLDAKHEWMLDASTERTPFAPGKTRVLRPNLNSARILAQSGWFTAHNYSRSLGRFVPLEANRTLTDSLTRLRIRGGDQAKRNILVELDSLGVNAQSLFPGIEGVCRHVNWIHGVA